MDQPAVGFVEDPQDGVFQPVYFQGSSNPPRAVAVHAAADNSVSDADRERRARRGSGRYITAK